MVIAPGLLLLLTLCPPAGNTATTTGEPHPAVDRSIRLLRDSRLPDAEPADELVRRLSGDVADAHPALIDVLVAGRVPALEEDESIQTLSVPQRELVLEALDSLPGDHLLIQAERLLASDDPERPGAPARAVASRLLALGAGAASLPRVIALATPAEEAPLDRRCAEALEWSIAALLAADGEAAHEALRHHLNTVPEALMPSVLRALGDDGNAAGLGVVLLIAERFPDVRPLAFAQMRRLGASGDPWLDRWVATLLRRHLDPDEPNLARSAALALGELSDPESVEALIVLLDDSPASSEAYWALCRISGMRLAPDAARWRRWHAEEVTFFGEDYEVCLRNLHGSHGARAAAAIRELSRHRLYRHDVARQLALALEKAPPARRRLLCNALEAMGSLPSAPALIPFLHDPDRTVAASALRALQSLSNLDLPRDPEAWRAALVGA